MTPIVVEIAKHADGLGTPIVVTNGYRVPVFANTPFCNLCGYSLDELIEAGPLGSLLPVDEPSSAKRTIFRENLQTNYPFQFTLTSRRKDGTHYLVGGYLLAFLEGKAGFRYVAIERELSSEDEAVFDCPNFKKAVRSVCNAISEVTL